MKMPRAVGIAISAAQFRAVSGLAKDEHSPGTAAELFNVAPGPIERQNQIQVDNGYGGLGTLPR
jgi:hypothetical protein